ncbi:hypothetical protein LV777_04095 [Providencia rettgeri]|uniref:hypothetical protein n=1 Tax=Providencia rettgeri TaxID=587 RepID=UPI002067176B|nr:hypothetical protein [Providencia rettgeri]UPQ40181.1 hypothetical protein LV777_04095 [Providencia rettgeri]
MLTLKYPTPVRAPKTALLPKDEHLYPGEFCLFDCPTQGEPALHQSHARSLGRLTTEIRRQLKTVSAMICHPHRVGLRNAVSVTLTNPNGLEVNLLLMVNGQVTFPERLDSPRWMIELTDSVDVVYLLLWLKAALQM